MHFDPPKIKKKDFNCYQFSTNKQYIKIKLMQNKTNHWSIFGKDKILVNLKFKDLNYHNFHIFGYN